MRRVIVWLTLRMFRVMNQGQGFAGVSVGDGEYKLHVCLGRDGLILREPILYSAWACAGQIVDLYKELKPKKIRRRT